MTDEKHTAKEWLKKLGGNPLSEKLSREQYLKMLQRQNTIKNLLNTGKNILTGIRRNLRPALHELGNRLQQNYDAAVGKPMYGEGIRNMLGYGERPAPGATNPRYYGYPPMAEPQYPREIYTIPPELLFGAAPPVTPLMPPLPPMLIPPPPVPQANPNEMQVVFLFDDKNDTISEVMSEFHTVPEAEAETAKLRKQGLPAFYAAKGEYINRTRLRA